MKLPTRAALALGELVVGRMVFRPFSMSSLVAQPPEMPDPMTMASYVFYSIISEKRKAGLRK